MAAVRTLFRDSPRYIVSDVTAGRHLAVSPKAYALLGRLDGVRPLPVALAELRLPPAEGEALLRQLIAAGLVSAPGLEAGVAAPVGPIEGKALFLRRELLELGPWMPLANRLMGWMFRPAVALLWAVLAITALLLFVADDGRSDVMAWVNQFDARAAVLLYILFLALKGLHELGHATALWRMAAAEGLPVQSIRAGIAVMLIMPFPFTNVTSAWRLRSKWRRAVVGVAGMYVESWIAIFAVLLWAASDDPLLRSAAIQVATVAAVTTLLFNLNPFGRMDGYYVASDLLERPNLMQRASAAAMVVPARLFRVRPAAELPRPDPWLIAYWLGMLSYRLLVFAGLVWLAHKLSPWAALLMLAVALSLLVVRPALGTGRRMLAMAAEPALVKRRMLLFAGAVLAFLFLLPLPAGVPATGVAEARGARFIYPPRDVRVAAVAPAGAGEGMALELESPELADAQRLATIRGAEAMARWRQSADLGGEGAQAAAEAAAGLQATAAALAGEEAMLQVPAEPGWDPLNAGDYAGSWVAPNPRQPLAIIIPSNDWRLHALVSEGDADRVRASFAQGRALAQARVAGRPDLRFRARIMAVADDATQKLPSEALGKPAGGPFTVDPTDPARRRTTVPMVEVWLVPEPGAPALRQGQRVELRLGAPARPLAWQAATAAMRLLDPQSER
ncbi:hypothetical protein FJQ54_01080 [Sandaracinobacter neustonicus]|uniref:Peptide zinc metalloprotease protein n=1 Tax=Sandaracinobacter neustonicus TaxID=1715348 RepID=A0A501XV12_9SPHN|nr:hypothetical protein [Sandaracinobacter neustonicus]TPE64622.1 hypothetical protein FJQ54_01080 [Sandaracinobacter neustonicus]